MTTTLRPDDQVTITDRVGNTAHGVLTSQKETLGIAAFSGRIVVARHGSSGWTLVPGIHVSDVMSPLPLQPSGGQQ